MRNSVQHENSSSMPPPGSTDTKTMVRWLSSVLGSMNQDCSSFEVLLDQFFYAQNFMAGVVNTVLPALEVRESELMAARQQITSMSLSLEQHQLDLQHKDNALAQGRLCENVLSTRVRELEAMVVRLSAASPVTMSPR